MSDIFKPKPGPVLRWSRGLHALWGIGATGLGGILWGAEGMALGGVAVTVGGFAWEVSNHYTPGKHRNGDGWDYLSFVAGALIPPILSAIF